MPDETRNSSIIYFSKSLTTEWDLSLALLRLNWFGKGEVQLRLAAIPRSQRERPRPIKDRDYLFVDYFQILPVFTFYQYFESTAELEVNLKAHLVLYKLIQGVLESLLVDLLPPDDN